LFFSAFNILTIKNKLNAKYKTKNIKTDPDEVFFAIMNQRIVKSNSSRNLRLKEKKVCIVWLLGSRDSPLWKIIIDTRVINVKTRVSNMKSDKKRTGCIAAKTRYPADRTTRLKTINWREFLRSDFTSIYHLIKSFIAV
jgi:hypothetical protein